MPTVTTKCKGRVDSGQCPEHVTYTRDPIPGITLRLPAETVVYLTCRLGHTCKYTATDTTLE